MNPARYRCILYGLCLIGLLARLPGLWRESLCVDEAFTALDAEGKCVVRFTNRPELDGIDVQALIQSPPRRLADVTDAVMAQDAHPPLFFGLTHGVARAAGVSQPTLRLLPLAAGTASILLLAALGRACANPSLGLTTAAVWTVMPYAVIYSWQARPYSLAVCFLILALLASLKVEENPRSHAAWRLLILYGLLSLWTHYASALMLIPLLMRLGGTARRKEAVGLYLLYMVVLFAGYLPWLPAFLAQQEWLRDGTGWLTGSVPAGHARLPAAAHSLGLTFYTLLFGEPAGPIRDASPGAWLRGGLFIGWMAALGYGFHKARQFERFRFLALPAAGAVGLALMIYLFLGVHMLAARYLMGILPLLALGMACALISAFAHPVLKWSFPVLLGTGLAMSLYVAYSDHRPGAEGWRESAAWVEDRCRPSDLILLNAPGIRVAFDRYFTGQAAEAGIGNETDARRMARKLQDVTHNRKRVWAVFSHTGPERGKEIIEQWLSLNYPRRIRQAFPGIEVCLFEKPSRY